MTKLSNFSDILARCIEIRDSRFDRYTAGICLAATCPWKHDSQETRETRPKRADDRLRTWHCFTLSSTLINYEVQVHNPAVRWRQSSRLEHLRRGLISISSPLSFNHHSAPIILQRRPRLQAYTNFHLSNLASLVHLTILPSMLLPMTTINSCQYCLPITWSPVNSPPIRLSHPTLITMTPFLPIKPSHCLSKKIRLSGAAGLVASNCENLQGQKHARVALVTDIVHIIKETLFQTCCCSTEICVCCCGPQPLSFSFHEHHVHLLLLPPARLLIWSISSNKVALGLGPKPPIIKSSLSLANSHFFTIVFFSFEAVIFPVEHLY